MENGKQFSRISNHMRTWLSWSHIYGQKASKDEIMEDINSIDIEDALSILAKFSVLESDSKAILIKTLQPFMTNNTLLENVVEPFDLTNLLYCSKWILAYGSKRSDYQGKFQKHFHIFLLVLKISDYMIDSLDNENEIQEQVLKGWLFNRSGELDRALIRQHVMFEKIARNKSLFEDNEFLDIHETFENYYGYTISDYVSVLFALHQPCVVELNLKDVFTDINWGIDRKSYFNNSKNRAISEQITKEVTCDISTLRHWARETISNPYDYELLLSKPIFKAHNKLFPFSPGILNTTIFDGLCFKLNKACADENKSFFTFFGRLFELYVSTVLQESIKDSNHISYSFIDEFSFDNEQKRSSDAYVLLGKSLLIIECKGGRLRKETKILAQQDFSEKDYVKYAIKPIEQANTAYKLILEESPVQFSKANKAFVLSVSLQAFPKVPMYNMTLESQLHPNIKGTDYIGISDLELLAYIINYHEFTVFKFIKNKKRLDEYVPYPNYYYNKYGLIKRTLFLDRMLDEATTNIRKTLFK